MKLKRWINEKLFFINPRAGRAAFHVWLHLFLINHFYSNLLKGIMENVKPWEIEWTEEKIKDYFDSNPFVTIERMVQLTGLDKDEIMDILMEKDPA